MRALAIVTILVGCSQPLPSELTELQSLDAEQSLGTCPDSAGAEAAESEFAALINTERQAISLAPLTVFWDLQDDARVWSHAMRNASEISHSPALGDVTSGWIRLGENVGVGPTVISLHDAFMASPGHAANVLEPRYGYLGVGVIIDDGTIWVTMVFMGADSAPTDVYPPFSDDDGLTHERNILAIYCAGITVGCGEDSYCPSRAVSRAEMAVFLTRALELPASNIDWFTDDDGGWYEAAVNAIADAGITLGCNPPVNDSYCPDDSVTRGQMAAFLTRALHLPAAEGDYFDDDAGRFYEASANSLKEAGITVGCGPRKYCGEDPVTRAQMATFLSRALSL